MDSEIVQESSFIMIHAFSGTTDWQYFCFEDKRKNLIVAVKSDVTKLISITELQNMSIVEFYTVNECR